MITSVALPGKTKESMMKDFLTCVPDLALARDGTKCRVGVVRERYTRYVTEHTHHFHLICQFTAPVRWKRWVMKMKRLGYPGHCNFWPAGTADQQWAAATKYLTDPAKDKEIDVGGLFGYEISPASIAKQNFHIACKRACCMASLGHYWKGYPLRHTPGCNKLGMGGYPYFTPNYY